MDDFVFVICFFLFISCIPAVVVGLVLLIGAAVNTRTWQKKKAERLQKSDVDESLIPKESDSDSDSELDVLDSEDEAERKDKKDAKREEEEDWLLTTKQKFYKELWNSWGTGARKSMERSKKMQERKDRRKLAKDMVKVMRRYERRRAKMEDRATQDASSSVVNKEGLPSYRNALDAKH